jgi:hypothetical protein
MVLSLVEVDMLELAGILQKLCDRCGQLSSWVYADITRHPKILSESKDALPASEVEKWDGASERRLHKRIPLKLPVLVRSTKGEQEISRTENISKGGVAVCLKMILMVGELIGVVCPYNVGAEYMEQRAEVRRRFPFGTGEKQLYGIRYLPR